MPHVTEYATTYRDGTRTTTCYSRSDGIRLYRYHGDNTWCVSFHSQWLPGVYADREAALLAVECSQQALEKATHSSVRGVGANYRPLTVEDLKEVK